MTAFHDLWLNTKQHHIHDFMAFGIVHGQLWAPAYINKKWRVLTLDLGVARKGAFNVFQLAGDGSNVVPLVKAAFSRKGSEAKRA